MSPPPKKVLIDRLLQCALYQQEKEILNNSETDSIHALFSIAKIYLTLLHANNKDTDSPAHQCTDGMDHVFLASAPLLFAIWKVQ